MPLLVWLLFVTLYKPVGGVCLKCSRAAVVLCGKCGRLCAQCSNAAHVDGDNQFHELYCWLGGERKRIEHGYIFVDNGALVMLAFPVSAITCQPTAQS